MNSYSELMDELCELEKDVNERMVELEAEGSAAGRSYVAQDEAIARCFTELADAQDAAGATEADVRALKEMSGVTTREYMHIQQRMSDIGQEADSSQFDDASQECLDALMRERNMIQERIAQVAEHLRSDGGCVLRCPLLRTDLREGVTLGPHAD